MQEGPWKLLVRVKVNSIVLFWRPVRVIADSGRGWSEGLEHPTAWANDGGSR